MTQRNAVPQDALIYVAGHQGLVGSAVWRRLELAGHTRLMGFSSKEVDLRDRAAVDQVFAEYTPDVVILAAARVGGILANATMPADFIEDNLRIQLNVMGAAQRAGVERLLFLGSSCIYPKFAKQPITESSLMTGELEPTNDAYAVAKIAGIMQVQALRRQHGVNYISVMPTNLYGTGDNFSPTHSHVLPALIRRFHEAKSVTWPMHCCSSSNTTIRPSPSTWVSVRTSPFANSPGRSPTWSAGRESSCSTRRSQTARRANSSMSLVSLPLAGRRAPLSKLGLSEPTSGSSPINPAYGRAT
jgi:hypothetical protein